MRVLILIIAILSVVELRSQIVRPDKPVKVEDTTSFSTRPDISSYLQKKKLSANIEFGTSFTSLRHGGSYFSTYVAPQLQYRLNNKLSLHGGFEMFNPMGEFGRNAERFADPFYGYGLHPRSLIYAGGSYQLTQNIVLSGTAFREIRPFYNQDFRSPVIDNDYKGVIMGVDYKVGENMFIRGQVEISNGMAPYHYHPFGRSQIFETDPFHAFPPF